MLMRVWSYRNSNSLLEEMESGAVTVENSLAVSFKLHISCVWPSNHSLQRLRHRLKTYVHLKACTMFTAALFKCPLAGEWIYIHLAVVHPDNGILSIIELSNHNTWRILKCIFLSERSQFEKAVVSMIPTIWHSGKGKTSNIIKNFNSWPGVQGKVEKNEEVEYGFFRAVKLVCKIQYKLKKGYICDTFEMISCLVMC